MRHRVRIRELLYLAAHGHAYTKHCERRAMRAELKSLRTDVIGGTEERVQRLDEASTEAMNEYGLRTGRALDGGGDGTRDVQAPREMDGHNREKQVRQRGSGPYLQGELTLTYIM